MKFSNTMQQINSEMAFGYHGLHFPGTGLPVLNEMINTWNIVFAFTHFPMMLCIHGLFEQRIKHAILDLLYIRYILN